MVLKMGFTRNEFQSGNRDNLHVLDNLANAGNLMSDKMLMARPFLPRASVPGDFKGQYLYQQAVYVNGDYSLQKLFQTLPEQGSFMNKMQSIPPSHLEKLVSP